MSTDKSGIDKLSFEDIKADFKKKTDRFEVLKGVVENLERVINDSDVGAVVSRRTGIPLSKMLTAEKDRLERAQKHRPERLRKDRLVLCQL